MATPKRRGYRSYFSMPHRGSGRGRGSWGAAEVLTVLFGLFIGVVVYSQFVLPELETLRCGPTHAEELALWEEVGGHGDPPVCESELPNVLQNLHELLPLIFIAPLTMLVFRQIAAPAIAPVMVMTWIIVWLVPSPLVDVAVVFLGLAACCVPHVVRGPVAAFSHAIALFLWPAFSLLAVDAIAAQTLPAGLDWALDFGVFLILPAVLIAVPVIGRRW